MLSSGDRLICSDTILVALFEMAVLYPALNDI